jgi:hypothetical protein
MGGAGISALKPPLRNTSPIGRPGRFGQSARLATNAVPRSPVTPPAERNSDGSRVGDPGRLHWTCEAKAGLPDLREEGAVT